MPCATHSENGFGSHLLPGTPDLLTLAHFVGDPPTAYFEMHQRRKDCGLGGDRVGKLVSCGHVASGHPVAKKANVFIRVTVGNQGKYLFKVHNLD